MSDEFDDLDAALAAHREKFIADMKRMVGAEPFHPEPPPRPENKNAA